MPTITNPTVTPDNSHKSSCTIKPPNRLGKGSPTPVTDAISVHYFIVHTLIENPTITSDYPQDVAYDIEKKAVHHIDASEEVDNLVQYPSIKYFKVDLYNMWVSNKEIFLDFKHQLNTTYKSLKGSVKDVV